MPMAIIAVAAVAAAGVSIYSAMNQPDAPSIPPPPPPASSSVTNEYGDVESEQIYENGHWTTKYYPYGKEPGDKNAPEYQSWLGKKASWENEKTQMGVLGAKLSAKINKETTFTYKNQFTGEEVTGDTGLTEAKESAAKVAEAYKGLKSDYAMDEYGNITKGQKESTEARGLTGSKYDVDITAQREKDYQKLLGNIGKEGVMLESDLNQKDFENTLNLKGYVDQGEKSDKIMALESQGKAAQLAQAGNADLLARYSIGNDNILNKWKIESDQNAAKTAAFGNFAGRLGMASAYGSAGKSPIAPKTPDTPKSRYSGFDSGAYNWRR